MKLLIEWEDGSIVLDPDRSYVLGRDPSADIAVADSKISRAHLQISFVNKAWELKDLDSSNGSYVGSKKFENYKLSKSVSIELGGIANKRFVFTPLTSSTAITPKGSFQAQDKEATKITKVSADQYFSDESGPRRVRLQQKIRIGRSEECDWFIEDINVSRTHAEIVQNASGGFEIVDLKSTNRNFLKWDQNKARGFKNRRCNLCGRFCP
jgi:pSer/pThr/pTyr-binding forkhead associated (FHA) protein